MKTKYKIIIVTGTILVLGGTLRYYRFHNRGPVPQRPITKILSPEDQELVDLEMLTDSNANEIDLSHAVVRLSMRKNSKALTWAVSHVQSKSRVLQNASLRALGYYNEPEAKEALTAALANADQAVRINSINSIGVNWDPARAETLKKRLEKPGLSEAEKASIYSIMLSNEAEKSEWRNKLLELSQNSKDMGARSYAFSQLVQKSPDDSRVTELAEKIVKSGDPKGAVPVAQSFLDRSKQKSETLSNQPIKNQKNR